MGAAIVLERAGSNCMDSMIEPPSAARSWEVLLRVSLRSSWPSTVVSE